MAGYFAFLTFKLNSNFCLWVFIKRAIEIGKVVSQKIAINIPQYLDIPILSIYSKDAQTYHKDICSTMFTATLFIIARIWKQPRCP